METFKSMSTIPLPPKTNRQMPAPPKPLEPSPTPSPPMKVQSNSVSCGGAGTLTDNESMIILQDCLIPSHQADPVVLAFINSYLICRNIRQAAHEAGVDTRKGRLLRNKPDIHLAISKLTEKSVNKFGYDASEVVERVKEMIDVDPIVFENPDGTFVTSLALIPPEVRRAIKKFKCKNVYEPDPNGMKIITGQLIEVELHDKQKAADLLGREKDTFKQTSKVIHDVTERMEQGLLGSRDRAKARIESQEGIKDVIDVTPAGEVKT